MKQNQIKNGDGFFQDVVNTKPFFKVALEGFAGTGKTFTAAKLAIGLHKKIKSKKSIVMVDTEKAAKFLKPMFAEAKIKLLVKESKSLADLVEAIERSQDGIADILIIDSISHIWEDFLGAFMKKVGRQRLQFQDWGIIKPTWKEQFSDKFVNSPLHILMCGRAGYEYDNEINEDTGKREIFKSGVKMKVEGETAYEPDLLLLMERFEEVLGKDKKVWREATVIKDRANLLDGKTFKNPTYEDFAPVIEAMLANPFDKKIELMPEKDAGILFRTEEEKAVWKRTRDILMEKLENVLKKIAPASTGKDAQLKIEILDFIFGTSSMSEIRQLRPEELREKQIKLCEHLVALKLAKIVKNSEGQNIVQKV